MKMLRIARKRAGLTMKELGARIGVSESAVSQYENGRREADFETLLKIGEVLHCSIDYLLRGDDEKTPTNTGERDITDNDIKFALFGGSDEITDAMYAEVRSFAEYVRQREEKKKE